jgi:hypothetical protein
MIWLLWIPTESSVGLCSGESPAELIGEEPHCGAVGDLPGLSQISSCPPPLSNLLNFRVVSLTSFRLNCLQQLVHIFSSSGLTRTITSTVYGGTQARRIPPHTIVPSLTLRPSSSSPTPLPGPCELWGFRLHMVHQLSPRQTASGVPSVICASA